MKQNDIFFKQAALLLKVIPFVSEEDCFALKGGTAINFFVRDLPRLSVDIDLVYLPIEPREESLQKISEALNRVASNLKKSPNSFKVQQGLTGSEKKRISKLFVSDGQTQIKIEPNEILRGTVLDCKELEVTNRVQEFFNMSASMRVVSIPDLYAGKICAALDRQHPRDLFDIKLLLENEGLTDEIRKVFVVYLAGHDRPMHELIDPTRKDVREAFEREFSGMTIPPTRYDELSSARESLIKIIRSSLTLNERNFLLSLKEMKPDWKLLGLPGIERLPSLQWKLINLKKMKPEKHAEQLAKLKKALEID